MTESISEESTGPFAPLESGSGLPSPPWWLTATDVGRAVVEAASFQAVRPMLASRHQDEPRPVLVLPGLLTGDVATRTLRRHLRTRGFYTHRWRLGVNRAFTDPLLDGITERLDELREHHARPISLVGWSVGGLMARWLARVRPDAVDRVIALGAPFRPEAEINRLSHLLHFALRHWGYSERTADVLETLRRPLPVPSVAIYSPLDGMLPWQGCHQDRSRLCENIVVPASHTGLCHNPAAILACADRLETPREPWRPFSWSRAVIDGIGLATGRSDGPAATPPGPGRVAA